MVIALTHMWNPNDHKLTDEVPELDLVLGGHDHDYHHYIPTNEDGSQKGEAFFVKSGCDFREYSFIEIEDHKEGDEFNATDFPLKVPCPNKGFTITCKREFVNLDVPRDKEMKKIVLEMTKEENKWLK